ncbi:MAG: c-type cytochrome [Bacteroidota bacterium]
MIKSVTISTLVIWLVLTAGLHSGARDKFTREWNTDTTTASGLIPDTTGMETAWDIPKNPLTDSLAVEKNLAGQIKLGFRLFTQTPQESRFASNKLSCSNCHLNAGQRERALPLVGVSGAFPEYNKRSGRLYSLEDRIVDCFKRSIDASKNDSLHNGDLDLFIPSTSSEEVLAIAAYISWLSSGFPTGNKISWRGQNTIPPDKQIPIKELNLHHGEALYRERCSNCHGDDGQGVEIGDKKAGPLWGDESWNDGAGAGRIYTLAGMFMYAMPYINPVSLSFREAQEIAAYIDSKPRSVYPYKNKDYLSEKIPPDAVYYHASIK